MEAFDRRRFTPDESAPKIKAIPEIDPSNDDFEEDKVDRAKRILRDEVVPRLKENDELFEFIRKAEAQDALDKARWAASMSQVEEDTTSEANQTGKELWDRDMRKVEEEKTTKITRPALRGKPIEPNKRKLEKHYPTGNESSIEIRDEKPAEKTNTIFQKIVSKILRYIKR